MDQGKKRSQLPAGSGQQSAVGSGEEAKPLWAVEEAFSVRYRCFFVGRTKKRSHLQVRQLVSAPWGKCGTGASPVLVYSSVCMGGAPMPRGRTIVAGRGLRIILGVAQMPLGWPTYPFD